MKLKLFAAALLSGGVAMAPAHAASIGFEDVPGLASSPWGYDSLSSFNSYAGFDWSASTSGVIVGTVTALDDLLTAALPSAYSNLPSVASGNYFSVLLAGENLSFSSTSGQAFSVRGAYFSSNIDGSTLLEYSAVIGGTTHTGSYTLASGSTTYVEFNLNNVSSFSLTPGKAVGFDNLDAVAAVPEPASLALTGFGVAVLAFKRRRAQRQVAA